MNPSDSKLIFLVGFMGSGKSHEGMLLAKHTGLPFVDLDTWIEEKESKSIAEIFRTSGEAYFRECESKSLREMKNVFSASDIALIGSNQISGIVSTGGGAPCFHENMEWMNAHGITIWLNPALSVLVERLRKEQEKRPLVASFNEKELSDFVATKLEERRRFYSRAAIEIKEEIDIALLTEKIKHA